MQLFFLCIINVTFAAFTTFTAFDVSLVNLLKYKLLTTPHLQIFNYKIERRLTETEQVKKNANLNMKRMTGVIEFG